MSISSPRIQIPRRAYVGLVLLTTLATESTYASNTGGTGFIE